MAGRGPAAAAAQRWSGAVALRARPSHRSTRAEHALRPLPRPARPPQRAEPALLRHSYVTHLIEAGYDPLFVQQQVGHEYASTLALYTSVSSDYKTTMVRRALDGEIARALNGVPLLAERGINLSAAQVYRLVAHPPERLSLRTLAALCDIFNCTPNDLLKPYAGPTALRKVAGEAPGKAPHKLRPKRARIVDQP